MNNRHVRGLQRTDFSMVHVDLANKPAWYKSINPNGLVPAVTFDGYVTTESIDICRYRMARRCVNYERCMGNTTCFHLAIWEWSARNARCKVTQRGHLHGMFLCPSS